MYELTIRVYAPNDADQEQRETLKQQIIDAISPVSGDWAMSPWRQNDPSYYASSSTPPSSAAATASTELPR